MWRYMDLAKFIVLVNDHRLHLTPLDRLDDPLEGRLAGAGNAPDAARPASCARGIYVSSWYLGEYESEAMWRLYCPGGQGVALRTRYERLRETAAAHRDMHVGLVRYLDETAGPLPGDDPLARVMHKRIAFAHEREVRLVAVRSDSGAPPAGIELDWDPADRIEQVYVDPYADAHFARAVETVVRRLAPALQARLVWSRMRVAPPA